MVNMSLAMVILQGAVQVTFDYDEAGKVRILNLVYHSQTEADQENHSIDIFTFLETDGDKNLIEKGIYELGDFDHNGYPERITIKTIRKENGISKLIFSWNGREVYEYESAHRILSAEAEYLDLDQDGAEEVFIRMHPEVNGGMSGAQLMEYVILKAVNGDWKPLETTQDEKNPSYETNSFPVSVLAGKEKNTIVISCEGYDKEITYDVSEHYEQLLEDFSEHPSPDVVQNIQSAVKKIDTLSPGEAFGYLAGWGIHNIKSSTFENKNCLVAEQRVEGLGGIYDPLGYLYIYFDYDSAGKIHILHMAFHPISSKR